MLEIISIGDVTEDIFVQVDELQLICNHEKENCLLCMKYADKIAAKRVDKLIGGNAGNVAIGSNGEILLAEFWERRILISRRIAYRQNVHLSHFSVGDRDLTVGPMDDVSCGHPWPQFSPLYNGQHQA